MKDRSSFLTSTPFLLPVAGLLLGAVIILGVMLLPIGLGAEAAEPLSLQPDTSDQALPEQSGLVELPAVEAPELADAAIFVADSLPVATQQRGELTYTGNVLPVDRVPVAVEVIGQVLQVNVDVGDRVQKGDILLQIDSVTLEAQRAQALAGLQAAQAQLDGILLDAEISDVNAARAALAAANSAHQKTLDGPSQEDLEIAESQMRQAEAAVTRAQAAYDRVAWNPAIAALPESMQLEQATLQLEAARAQYEKIAQGATDDVISGAYSKVVAAQAQLDRLLKGAKQPQIDALQAQINQAETALFLTQLQVDKATLRAPIDGIVSEVRTSAGANVAPGSPVFQLLSNDVKIVIPVEESQLAKVVKGQPVTIRVNAYPERTFAGEVVNIAPELNPTTRTTDVTIRPVEDAPELSPGMFATVTLDN